MLDRDQCADRHVLVKVCDFARTHPNAAVTDGFAELRFLDGAVNIDAARFGVGVPLFESFEPEHPGDNRITAGRIDRKNLAGRMPMPDHRANRQFAPNLFANSQQPNRRLVAAVIVAESEFGGRDAVLADPHSIAQHDEALLGDADDHFEGGRLDFLSQRGGRVEGDQSECRKLFCLHRGVPCKRPRAIGQGRFGGSARSGGFQRTAQGLAHSERCRVVGTRD